MKEEIKKIAKLASLQLEESEVEKLAPQFQNILKYVSKIEELDLDDCEPLFTLVEDYNVLRQDEAGESIPTKDALKNAPKKNEQFFKVPKVLGGDV